MKLLKTRWDHWLFLDTLRWPHTKRTHPIASAWTLNLLYNSPYRQPFMCQLPAWLRLRSCFSAAPEPAPPLQPPPQAPVNLSIRMTTCVPAHISMRMSIHKSIHTVAGLYKCMRGQLLAKAI